MNIYFIILIAIYILNIGVNLGKHGQARKGEYNFYTSLAGSAIGMTLLYLAVKTGL